MPDGEGIRAPISPMLEKMLYKVITLSTGKKESCNTKYNISNAASNKGLLAGNRPAQNESCQKEKENI